MLHLAALLSALAKLFHQLVTDGLVRYDATLLYSFIDFNNETLPTTFEKKTSLKLTRNTIVS